MASIMLQGSVDALIESAARRGNIPDSQMTYVLTDFLAMAEEELSAYALPVLHARREDYYLEEIVFSMSDPDTYVGAMAPATNPCPAWRLPDWAMASTVRDVQAVSASGNFYNLGRITVDDQPNMISQGWFFYGNYIVYQGNSAHSAAPPVALRCIAHVKPNRLTKTTTAYTDIGVTDAGINIPGKVLFNIAGTITFTSPVIINGPVDIISGKPGYEVKARAIDNWSGFNTQWSSPNIPANVTVEPGDFICQSGFTCMVPLPTELHPLLAQRLVVKFLEAQGEGEQLDKARMALDEMVRQVPLLIQPRAEGKPKKLAPRLGLWRRWRW